MITRRDLLKGIIATATAPAVIKLERLMKVKTIVVPELAIFHVVDECSFLSSEMITKEALKILHHNLILHGVGSYTINHNAFRNDKLTIYHPNKFTIEGIHER